MSSPRITLMICAGTGCSSNLSLDIKNAFIDEIRTQGLDSDISVTTTGCNGICGIGPTMVVQPEGTYYHSLSIHDVPRIVEQHLIKGMPVPELMYTQPLSKDAALVPRMNEIGFFKKQFLIALRNRGIIDPEKIDEYIARDGYKALTKALLEMSPEEVVAEVKKSGLRGRGGAGFPTGLKWEMCRKSEGDEKYVICNGDEGDPGAFMDRSIVESDPHSVIEGMIIGAYAMGASSGILYIRDEYPLAVERLNLAIDQARAYGLLGEDILGSGFDFDLSVSRGAGAFVCGEETSLIGSLEGRMPEPMPRPPFPAVAGYRGKPTNINNVETWANIAPIILKGSSWFSSIGTGTSKGTKVFSIVGKLVNTGLVEVPMGVSMRDIVFEIGGGIANGKKFKAVQTGGPSGGCLPESLLDVPIDYETLKKNGAIMGSGGLIVMDEDTCMVEVARYFLGFTQDESCGKCPPCREGTRHMFEILSAITEGKGQEGDIELLQEMGQQIIGASLCALGGTAPNPVLTTIRYFRHEYDAHIKDHRCPARVCKALIAYDILPDTCTGCHACFKKCPTQAISGEVKKSHVIDKDKCIKCGMCFEVCKFGAVRYQ